MSLDFFDDVLLLDFALEAVQRTFQGFSILDLDFSQTQPTYLLRLYDINFFLSTQ